MQQGVAAALAVTVVDRIEVVEADEDERKFPVLPPVFSENLFKAR
jgi:hypothetical protein